MISIAIVVAVTALLIYGALRFLVNLFNPLEHD